MLTDIFCECEDEKQGQEGEASVEAIKLCHNSTTTNLCLIY